MNLRSGKKQSARRAVSAASSVLELAAYRSAIARSFRALGREAQKTMADQLAVLPRHVHRLAMEGLLAAPPEPNKR
jgi:hypothetical protein